MPRQLRLLLLELSILDQVQDFIELKLGLSRDLADELGDLGGLGLVLLEQELDDALEGDVRAVHDGVEAQALDHGEVHEVVLEAEDALHEEDLVLLAHVERLQLRTDQVQPGPDLEDGDEAAK